MAFCEKCGRQLAENEVCECAAQDPQMNQGVDPYAANNGQPYPNQPAPKKKSGVFVGCLIAALIVGGGLLLVGIILAIILVPSMLGYVAKSKQASINSNARTLFNAAATTLAELDAQGVDVGGTYILCSDDSMNIGTPSNEDALYDTIEKYFDSVEEFEYFIVFSDYSVYYVAISEDGSSPIGTSPTATSPSEGPVTFYGSTGEEDWDLDDLYLDTYSSLFDY